MGWRYHWPTDDDLCMRVCVWWCCWCGVLFENSRVCFVQYVLGTTVCCVVMMCIGETGCCDSALVPPFFCEWGVGVRGWYRICFLILLRSCLVWSCSSENFVVVSAGWDIRVGCRAWGALVCLVLCVLIVFCFVSSSLFFWELWDHAFAFCFCNGEFDSGSGRTLAACLTHASRTMKPSLLGGLVANGWVIREWPTFDSGISLGNWV